MSVYDFQNFKNSNFGEDIVYTAKDTSAVTIKAVVFRNGAQKQTIRTGAPSFFYPIIVELDREDISSVTENEDKITCDDANGQSKQYRVSKILASDAGCLKLGLGL